MLHLKKFTLNEDWTPRKLDVAVEMPDELSLNQLRGKGLQPNEEPLQDLQGPPPSKFAGHIDKFCLTDSSCSCPTG
jgi:ubiquitin carboxyl-terminal hydrolase 5/13